MNKVIIAVFDSEAKAFEGLTAMKSLHADGTISIYATAVVSKDANGKAAVKEETDEGPLGTLIGMFTGGLIGMWAGPAGMVIGAGFGAMGGGIYDFSKADVDVDFVNEVMEVLTPGKVALLADVEETWTTPVDTRLNDLGGLVFRRNRYEVEDESYARESAALNAEMDELEEEYKEANAQMKESIKKQIDKVKVKSKALNEATQKRMHHVKEETDAKVAKLHKQIEKSNKLNKKKLEKNLAKLKENHKARMAKLEESTKKLKNIVL